MIRMLFLCLSLWLFLNPLCSQPFTERDDNFGRELFEREMKHPGLQRGSANIPTEPLGVKALKSEMEDIGNPPDWNWVRAFAGGGGADIIDMVVDASKNIFAYGTFADSMRIGSTTLVSKGRRDVFIAKIGNLGNLSWLKQLEAAPDENLYADKIALTPTGVVISGRLRSSSISGGGITKTSSGIENHFMAHIGTGGTVNWIHIDSSPNTLKILSDNDGNIYRLNSACLQKFDSGGDPLWLAESGAMLDFTTGVAGIWVTGAVTDTGVFVGDSVFHWDYKTGAFYLANLDTDGKFGRVEFMPTYINSPANVDMKVESDAGGDLYLAAGIMDAVIFRDSLITNWPNQGFLMKLDPGMNIEWLRYKELTPYTSFENLLKVSDNQYYVYGTYYDSIILGNYRIVKDQGTGYFLAELDAAGEVVNLYTYDTPLYVYELQPGNVLYHVSYDVYDHWLHKKLLSGAESWTVQVWNNGGGASIWYTMDIDEDGNLYAQGYYTGTVRILGAVTKGRGVFFVKFRNDGEVEWFKFMENPAGSPSGIKVDDQENVYAWGGFSDYIRIEGQEYHNNDPDGTDIYLIKFDRDGDLKFVKQFDGKGTMIGTGGIELSPENDILLCGQFSDTLVLGAYVLTCDPLYYDMFVTKISPNGNVVWARSYGGPSLDWARSIVSDSLGNIYFTGAFRNSIAFDNIELQKASGAYEFTLVKLDPNGNVKWAKMGGPDNYYTRGHSIAIHDDRLYIQGIAYTYAGMPTVTFGDKTLISEFDNNSFLACYSLDGKVNWVKLAKVNYYSWPLYKIDTDPAGNVYAGGIFQDTLVVESNLIAGSGGDDYYIMKYNPQGELQWLKTSETGNNGQVDMFCLVVFDEDMVLVGGRIYDGSVTVGEQVIKSASTASFAGLLGRDIIGCTMKLAVQVSDADFREADGSISVTVSGGTPPYSYEWSNGEVGTPSIDSLPAGTYQVTVVDDRGCEQFGVYPVNIKNGPVIHLDEIGNVSCNGLADGYINISVSGGTQPYTYYWDNGYSSEDLTGLVAAPYAVTVTDAGGLVTSATYTVQQPKPLNVSYTLKPASCGGGSDGGIEVFTSGGTTPYDWEWNTGVFTQSLSGEPAGKYSLIVRDANNCQLNVQMALGEKNAPIVETDYVEAASCDMSDGAAGVRVINATGNLNFLWSDAAATTTNQITAQKARGYFVTVTNEAGCKAVHLVDIPEKKPVDNQICLVTVDTVIGSNLVVWEKVADAIRYNIYRETTLKDVYLLAGSVAGEDLSVFVDTVANPQVRSYRYKIGALDECGNESYLSHLHKTVHLTISPGLSDNIMNLRWDDYVGEDFDKFEIWRYTSLYGWELLTELPSTLKSYTDFSVPPGRVFYNVRVPFPDPCVPTGSLRKAGTGPYTHALSNLDDNKKLSPGGTGSLSAPGFFVYPNPTGGPVIVWSEAFLITDGELRVTDLAGRLVMQKKIRNNFSGRLELDLSGQPAGSYLVQLSIRGQVFHQKLVKF